MDTINISAHAKINLALQITGRRDDGYHNLKTVMQSISLADTVTIKRNNSDFISVSCSDTYIPSGGGNIACKAAKAFFEAAGISHTGTEIEIDKHIPHQAGLGGGSADAAAVIYGLNILCSTNFAVERLCEIGVSIGADIPFCLVGGTALCEGIGEKITPMPLIPDCHIVIAKGSEGISTKDAYSRIDALGKLPEYDFDVSGFSTDIITVSKACSNIFERAANIPEIIKIKNIMLQNGALTSIMTGSGSAVFGIFTDKMLSVSCAQILSDNGFFSNISKPVNAGVKIV